MPPGSSLLPPTPPHLISSTSTSNDAGDNPPTPEAHLAALEKRRHRIIPRISFTKSRKSTEYAPDDSGERTTGNLDANHTVMASEATVPDIGFDDARHDRNALDTSEPGKDLYQWAVLYENQRGYVPLRQLVPGV
jgi:hypothetical protein